MGRVVHFEISANDPEKMAAFYRDVFDWEIKQWAGPVDYWLITTGDAKTVGIDGAFFRPREEFTGTINTIDVDDLDAAVERVRRAGGQVVTEKSVIPGVGYQVYCKDVEGTLFGLHQQDLKAGQSLA